MAQVLVDEYGGKLGEVAASFGIGPTTPGFSLLVSREGSVTFEGAFGAADLATGRLNDPRDNFIIASNTKQFTCLTVLMMADRGLLDLGGPIGEVLTELPPAYAGLTPLDLMHHTAGVPDYTDDAYYADETATTASAADIITRVTSVKEPDFAPGTAWSYSNTAYLMLGELVARLTGRPFGAFLTEEVLRPLGMAHSFAPDDAYHRDRWQVVGYGRPGMEGAGLLGLPESRKTPSDEPPSWFAYPYDMRQVGYADGNVSSNVEDLLLWHGWLHDGTGPQLVSPELKRLYFTDVELADGRPTGYSLGIDLGTPGGACTASSLEPHVAGHKEIFHTGGTSGFVSCLGRFPDDGTSVLMLCNDDGLDDFKLYAALAACVLEG